MTQFLRSWRFPIAPPTGQATETYDVPVGATNIDIPSTILQNYRNLSLEFVFTGVTASDANLQVQFFRANDVLAFNAGNIESLGSPITITSQLAADPELVFVRDIKNIDNKFLRAVVTGPSGVTASLVLNVAAGGLVT